MEELRHFVCVSPQGRGCKRTRTEFSSALSAVDFTSVEKICGGVVEDEDQEGTISRSAIATVGSGELLIFQWPFLFFPFLVFLGRGEPIPEELLLQLCTALIKLKPMGKTLESGEWASRR